MAEAARQCILADKNFVKGYFRLAVAQKALNDLPNCIKTLENGLGIQSNNPDLKRMKKEVTELQRGEQVATYCRQADEQMQNGDIGAAMKTLELASRLDAGNPDIGKMMSKIKPKWEAMEKKRKAILSPVERFKEQGDECYKNADFEVAIGHYTKAIDQLVKDGKVGSDLALKAYSNRAGTFENIIMGDRGRHFYSHTSRALIACYKQISNFDGVIADCTAVLEVEPQNVKALVRRAQAFEGVERYRFALQDVKAVLAMPYSQVGKANFDLCNGMQHRLNRTVAQLKKMNSS
jgi:stress-induced-phosphoprotein 1